MDKEPKVYASFDDAVKSRLKSVSQWGGAPNMPCVFRFVPLAAVALPPRGLLCCCVISPSGDIANLRLSPNCSDRQ